MHNNVPAIVVVAYNRIKSLSRLLNSIGNAEYTDKNIPLIISIDYSEKMKEIISLVEKFQWSNGEKIIIKHTVNQGLKKHILSCGNLSNKYESVIILEDDLIVSEDYYIYAQNALDFYADEKKIVGISLYSHRWNGYANYPFQPVISDKSNYFGQFSITWGQVWNSKNWNEFVTWYEEQKDSFLVDGILPSNVYCWGNNSWGKYFFKYIVQNNLFYVIPYVSKTTNYNEEGVHSTESVIHQVPLQKGIPQYNFDKFSKNSIKYDAFFERIFSEKICGINPEKICIDLNGTKYSFKNRYEYLLTCRKYPYEIIDSFGMEMRPIDVNIDYNVSGKLLKLYRINSSIDYRIKKHPKRKERIYYDICGFWWFDLIPFVRKGIIFQVGCFLKKFFRRK